MVSVNLLSHQRAYSTSKRDFECDNESEYEGWGCQISQLSHQCCMDLKNNINIFIGQYIYTHMRCPVYPPLNKYSCTVLVSAANTG